MALFNIGDQVTIRISRTINDDPSIEPNTVVINFEEVVITDIVIRHRTEAESVYIGTFGNNDEHEFQHQDIVGATITATAPETPRMNFEAVPRATMTDPLDLEGTRFRWTVGADRSGIWEQFRPTQEPLPPVTNILTADSLTGRLTQSDFRPARGTTQFVSHRIRVGAGIVTVTPVAVDDDRYEFIDLDRGTRWVNSIQHNDITIIERSTASVFRDTASGIRWMKRADYLFHAKKFSLKGSKKLRQKYDTMPEILNESNYAGPEFIA